MTLENLQCSLLLNAAAVWVMGFWAMGVICGSGVVFFLFLVIIIVLYSVFYCHFQSNGNSYPFFFKIEELKEWFGCCVVAWVCDQDAYACSGQKCSAQSILFMHENWSTSSLISKIKDLAERRKLADLTVGPVLTVTTEAMLEHKKKLLQISGSKLLFGGEPLENHSIPAIYGAIKPTAIYIPLEEILKPANYELVTKEIFGPFQIITDYKKDQLPMVLDALERMHAHLTAAVVSNDPIFLQDVIGKTVNGTTYAGLRARTTGAPQNHWFGPAGDPRGAGIGTPEAIKLVWSCHREIIYDFGPVPRGWEIPSST